MANHTTAIWGGGGGGNGGGGGGAGRVGGPGGEKKGGWGQDPAPLVPSSPLPRFQAPLGGGPYHQGTPGEQYTARHATPHANPAPLRSPAPPAHQPQVPLGMQLQAKA